MSTQEQIGDISAELGSSQVPVQLCLAEDFVEDKSDTSSASVEVDNYIDVVCVERYVLDDGREHRIDFLTLPDDEYQRRRTYACVVTDANPELVPDPNDAALAVLVHGFTEVPSAKNTTGANRHNAHALKWPAMRTLSVDELGYSEYAPSSPLEAIKHARQGKKLAAADLIKIARHYNPSNKPTRLVGTSAGYTKIIEVITQTYANATATKTGKMPEQAGVTAILDIIAKKADAGKDNQLHIGQEVYGNAPCMVTTNVPPEYNDFRPTEPAQVTRFKTILKFGGHCAINLAESTIHDPKAIWSSRGILKTWAKNPMLLVMLPIQFAGHAEGTPFEDIVNAALRHDIITVGGATDPLTSEGQNAAINRAVQDIIPERLLGIDSWIEEKEGHVSLPLNHEKSLSLLGLGGEEAAPPVQNIVELGLHLMTSAAEQAGGLAIRQADRLTFGLGRRALGLFRQSEEATDYEENSSQALAAA